MKRFNSMLKMTTMAIAAAGLISTSALATDGMFGNGTGARNKALAGAGVADQNDATAIAINPAGLVHSDTQFSMSASLFSPRREAEWQGGWSSESDRNYFVVPNIAYAYRVDANTVFGLSVYGNGGMNTDYPVNPLGFSSNMGVDLTQAFMAAALAKKYGNISVGVSPILAVQYFSANGLGDPTIPYYMSEDDNISFGIGVRGGVEWAVTPNFRVGVSGATPMWSTAFEDYKNDLLAISDGEIRVPATVQAGIAFDLMPNLTVMADYKRIFYSSSEAISGDIAPAGGGFGWNDISIYKFGVEWDVNPDLTLRAGYSYNEDPLPTDANAYFANTLVPATTRHHITAGAKMKMTDSIDLELAGMYAPECSVSTPGAAPATPASTVKMYQWEATAGFVWHLGEPEAPLK